MISGELLNLNNWFDAHHLIEAGGILLLIAIIYIETGFFLGFVLPGGDYILFAAGLFCGSHFLDVPLLALVLLLITASFLGDLTGYLKGKWLGGKLFTKENTRFFKQSYLEKGKKFYDNYGIWAFILGRFMPVIRTLVPMIAGATVFPFKRFLFYNAAGAIVWIGLLVPLGYYVGREYPQVIDYSGYVLLGFIMIASFPMLKILFSKNNKS